MSGPFAILMSFISELLSKNYRSRVMISLGIIYSLGDIALPVLAGLLIPQKLHFTVIEGILGNHFEIVHQTQMNKIILIHRIQNMANFHCNLCDTELDKWNHLDIFAGKSQIFNEQRTEFGGLGSVQKNIPNQ
jgi:hypothetical protein